MLELAAELIGPDPDDLLHRAAAIQSGCEVLLTNNTCDFTPVDPKPHDVWGDPKSKAELAEVAVLGDDDIVALA